MRGTQIKQLLRDLDALLVAHFYQKDRIVALADIVGDSLQLAQKASASPKNLVVFCGVGFMGESLKILAPQKEVIMPKLACCSMAKMLEGADFDTSLEQLRSLGIEDLLPITYINSSARIKAKVGKAGGFVCTSANASKIFAHAQKSQQKIFFLPDRCLGVNLAHMHGLKSAILGLDGPETIKEAEVICYNGFCAVHQLFKPSDIEFFRQKYPDILIAVHPECAPEVVQLADFVGSTSQIINFVQNLPLEQKVAVGTEINLIKRLRPKNTYVLSSSVPECPTMNETDLDDLFSVLKAYKNHSPYNCISVEAEVAKWAKVALDKMMELS
ncbi:quinolinate synthase NadA [Helicobacter ailurogastricus]|uniref:Quinolinate synthase n=1 Tax=Helicobacter ailurogastricus TaxID=1578720 RepID=A0A0K2XB19_9HELI|nr:quinolinate synthase NadA [Helicobacter ailurogastricus]CRF40775.1 Quinolinate synthetase [Helicobacter ailurogastricus]CRF41889.1 Quinolinate synthetase [Helicobacter ailurogastricus]CRF44972.1 Quinolinate synthetase [Helicobacter ailurogastricus]